MSGLSPKVYTVASNARRDARRLGISTEVETVEGGFVLVAQKPAADAAAAVDLKAMGLRVALATDWRSVPDLCAAFGWLPHTLRARISGIGGIVERQRVDGVTSYRLAPGDPI